MGTRAVANRCRVIAAAMLAAAACSAEAANDRTSAADDRQASAEASGETQTPGCELITLEEIEAASGLAAARAEWDEDSLRGCSWYAESGRPLLSLVVGAAPATYEMYVQNLRGQEDDMGPLLEGVDTSSVAGIGDYAIWHEGGGSSYLNAARDGELLVLMIYEDPPNGRSRRDAVVELARMGVPRL